MSIFSFLNRKCYFCNRKIKPLRNYVNDKGKVVRVCLACSEYAERRAYRLKK